ncbi:hypothetical protein HPB49_008726 [Dermacentor silvarum]|uniref:Uncharacterized protein n=1 Tax=Dermacentor silvarum TaxID=543639 RepID=A0ACB8D472_DERSI|nr:hypothetical protein HPB49_008726 [Dermacentor silvarum]
MSIEDVCESSATKSLAHFRKTSRKCNGRYAVALPWKEDRKHLIGDNRGIAVHRLKKPVSRLSRHEGLLQRYDTVIRQYMSHGHAEVVTENVHDHHPVCYIPHREVIKEDSLTTKLRVVFNASSQAP